MSRRPLTALGGSSDGAREQQYGEDRNDDPGHQQQHRGCGFGREPDAPEDQDHNGGDREDDPGDVVFAQVGDDHAVKTSRPRPCVPSRGAGRGRLG